MDETPTTPDYVPQPSPTPPVPPPSVPPPPVPSPAPPSPADTDDAHRGRRIAGIILILVGLFFYAQQFLPALSWAILWPAILIVIGIYVLLKGRRS